MKPKVFISYSHKDEDYRNKLDKHLSLLKRHDHIDVWYDRELLPGDNFDEVIKQEIEKADIFIFFVSIDFLVSDYITEVEVPRALERQKEGSARVIPIAVDGTSWEDELFKGLVALPEDKKPIKDWDNDENAFHNIREGIKKVAEHWKASHQTTKDDGPSTEKFEILLKQTAEYLQNGARCQRHLINQLTIADNSTCPVIINNLYSLDFETAKKFLLDLYETVRAEGEQNVVVQIARRLLPHLYVRQPEIRKSCPKDLGTCQIHDLPAGFNLFAEVVLAGNELRPTQFTWNKKVKNPYEELPHTAHGLVGQPPEEGPKRSIHDTLLEEIARQNTGQFLDGFINLPEPARTKVINSSLEAVYGKKGRPFIHDGERMAPESHRQDWERTLRQIAERYPNIVVSRSDFEFSAKQFSLLLSICHLFHLVPEA